MNIWKRQHNEKHHKHGTPRQPRDDEPDTSNPNLCVVCNGKGEVETTEIRKGQVVSVLDTCPACGGDGKA